jgi:hypothetical protein
MLIQSIPTTADVTQVVPLPIFDVDSPNTPQGIF